MTEDEFRKQVNVQTKQKPSESDLLRVIELAYVALDDLRLWSVWACEKMDLLSDPPLFPEYTQAQQALSEIRKLKGE
jgi:hypothetical protein